MAITEEREFILPAGTCPRCGTSVAKDATTRVIERSEAGEVIEVEEPILIDKEQRVFETPMFRVVADVLIGLNEELYIAGSNTPIDAGRQEIVTGIRRVDYNSTLGGGRKPTWQNLESLDIGQLLSENKQLKADKLRLEREIDVHKRRVETLGLGSHSEV
ncbi:MAG: hypothetical protein V6Z81_06445 [Parvularculales bacterium]